MDKATDAEKKPSRMIMVTGGQRSGKSLFAEKLALTLSDHPTYLATARVYDEEIRRRVEVHKQRRQHQWRNLEAPLTLDGISISPQETVLVDCLTMWATNWLLEKNENMKEAYSHLKDGIDELRATGATLIIVTNEIGLGGVSPNELQRKFTDLQGMINQYVASLSDEVYLLVSGIPVKIKTTSYTSC